MREFDGLGWISGFVVVALPGIVGTGGAGVWVGFALIFVGTDYVGQFESPLSKLYSLLIVGEITINLLMGFLVVELV